MREDSYQEKTCSHAVRKFNINIGPLNMFKLKIILSEWLRRESREIQGNSNDSKSMSPAFSMV